MKERAYTARRIMWMIRDYEPKITKSTVLISFFFFLKTVQKLFLTTPKFSE